jgi:ADP-dependent NAD(P)H-hydrate dehydratase / NAD(P)H-hydrate epimerase
MKILNAEQIRAWDQYSMRHEPVTSIDLMERAARKCFDWMERNEFTQRPVVICCGKGNNGGDGLAIARMILEKGAKVTIYILEFGHKGTDDFQHNLEQLHRYPQSDIHFIQDLPTLSLPSFPSHAVIVDALFGSGLSRPLEGMTAQLVEHINRSGCPVISIDMPSGLSADHSSKGNTAVKASHTLSFQCYKLGLLVAENAAYTGKVHILDIGLHTDYEKGIDTDYEVSDMALIGSIYQPRNQFAHKGNFGHALLVAGSYGKIGAAVLAAKACLRSGVGLLTCHIPSCGYDILQSTVPEAMVKTDFNSSFNTKIELQNYVYDVIGIGPGIGTASETRNMLKDLFANYHQPMVLDADALNSIAMEEQLLHSIPAHSILTPHPKEFERLFGKTENEFLRIGLAGRKAKELNVVIVVKGHHTLIATPSGKCFFNSTGNAGMATAGSGDVLTGILTGLLAQGYNSVSAAVLGVYLHGLAGDIAAADQSPEAMVAGDIVSFLGRGFQTLFPLSLPSVLRKLL